MGESSDLWRASSICGGQGKEPEGGELGGGQCAVWERVNASAQVRVLRVVWIRSQGGSHRFLGYGRRFWPAKYRAKIFRARLLLKCEVAKYLAFWPKYFGSKQRHALSRTSIEVNNDNARVNTFFE